MPESKRLVDLVQSRIDEYLMSRAPIVTLISSDLTPLIDYSRQFLSGGKRFRAQFCYWGVAFCFGVFLDGFAGVAIADCSRSDGVEFWHPRIGQFVGLLDRSVDSLRGDRRSN